MRFFGRIHPVPVLAGIVVAVIAVQLGNWQRSRAAEKHELGARIAHFAASEVAELPSVSGAQPAVWSQLRLRGRWQSDATLYLDNRVHERRPGYHVLMPLRLADGSAVLVNRGWIPAGFDRSVLPVPITPTAEVEVAGRVTVPEKDPFSLGASPRDGARWQYVDLEAYREASGVPVAAWVLQQTSDSGDGLVRDWPAPDLGEDKHRGYALQWYSLAALALALTGFYVFRSFRKHAA